MVQRLDSGQVPSDSDILIEPLGFHHNRAAFVCSKPNLTQYFTGETSDPNHRNIEKDMRLRLVMPFVMVDKRDGSILGYFTLANMSIPKDSFSRKVAAAIGYKDVPAMLLGRMAVAEHIAGHGLGKKLLLAALIQIYRQTANGLGCFAVVLEAGDDSLLEWYSKVAGFKHVPTDSSPRRMVLPMQKIVDDINSHSTQRSNAA